MLICFAYLARHQPAPTSPLSRPVAFRMFSAFVVYMRFTRIYAHTFPFFATGEGKITDHPMERRSVCISVAVAFCASMEMRTELETGRGKDLIINV